MPLTHGVEPLASLTRPPVGKILTLGQRGNDLFRGESHTNARRIYGGQTLGQALVAAGRTVERDHNPHSLHGHFIHPGRSDLPVDYIVERVRDGGSFTTRLVRALQNDRTILLATASFQRDEDGLTHQDTATTPAPYPKISHASKTASTLPIRATRSGSAN